jgi:N-acetylglutamate synthase-like GNAT family acetyltransferase
MNSFYAIRIAGPRDLAALKEVLTRNGQRPTIVMDESTLFYTAEGEGQGLVGLAGAELSGRAALIRSTAVLAPHRGKGLAKRLVEALLADLTQKGIRHLYLFSRDTGSFWQAFGFTHCPVEEVIGELAGTPQVMGYLGDGSIWSDVAWRREM